MNHFFRKLFILFLVLCPGLVLAQGIRPSPPPTKGVSPLWNNGNELRCYMASDWQYDQNFLDSSYGAQCVSGDSSTFQKFTGSKEFQDRVDPVDGSAFLSIANPIETTGAAASLNFRTSSLLSRSKSASIQATNVNGDAVQLRSGFFFDGSYSLQTGTEAPDHWNHNGALRWWQCNVVQVDTASSATGTIWTAGTYGVSSAGARVSYSGSPSVVEFRVWDSVDGDQVVTVNTSATLWPGNWLVCYGRVDDGSNAPYLTLKVNELAVATTTLPCSTGGTCLTEQDESVRSVFATDGFYGGLFAMVSYEDWNDNVVNGDATRLNQIWTYFSTTKFDEWSNVLPTGETGYLAYCDPVNRDYWSCGSHSNCWACNGQSSKPYSYSYNSILSFYTDSGDPPWNTAEATGYYPTYLDPDDRTEMNFFVWDGAASQKIMTLKASKSTGSGATRSLTLAPGVQFIGPSGRATFDFAAHTGNSCGAVNTVLEATAAGASGNDITITVVNDSYLTNQPWIEVVGSAVTIHYAMYWSGNYAADIEAAIDALSGESKIIAVKTPDTLANDFDCEFGPVHMDGGVDSAPVTSTSYLDVTGKQPANSFGLRLLGGDLQLSKDLKIDLAASDGTLGVYGVGKLYPLVEGSATLNQVSSKGEAWFQNGLNIAPPVTGASWGTRGKGGPVLPTFSFATTGVGTINTVVEATSTSLSPVISLENTGSTGISVLGSSVTITFEDDVTTVAQMESLISGLTGVSKILRVKTPSSNPTYRIRWSDWFSNYRVPWETNNPPQSKITSSYGWQLPCPGSGENPLPNDGNIGANACIKYQFNAATAGAWATFVGMDSTMICTRQGVIRLNGSPVDSISVRCEPRGPEDSSGGYDVIFCNTGPVTGVLETESGLGDACSINVRVFNTRTGY